LLEESLFAVALLNVALWAEPRAGAARRRAVSLPADRAIAGRYREWIARLVRECLQQARSAIAVANLA
jgi:hypothetical protein